MLTRITEYEYIWPRATFGERLALARELAKAIGAKRLWVIIPNQADTEKFVRSIMPESFHDGKWTLCEGVDEEFIRHHARALRKWLAGYHKRVGE